jgi:hypothetical protein
VQIFAVHFVGDKAEIRSQALCLSRISNAVSGKISRKDVRGFRGDMFLSPHGTVLKMCGITFV